MNYGVIILAAGKSSRFGRNKLVEPLNGIPVILHSILQFEEIRTISEIVVVLSTNANKITSLLGDKSVQMVINRRHHTGGMISSIECGLNLLSNKSIDGIFIHLGDIPFISSETIEGMIKKMEQTSKIIVPTYEGNNGHPLLIPEVFRSELHQLDDKTQGLRGFLKKQRPNILYHETDHPGILIDIDCQEDLERLESFPQNW